MTRKDILAAAFLACTLAAIAVGCRPGAATMAVKAVEQTAEQAVVVVEPIKLYYSASVALFVVGGLVAAIGGRVAGGTLIATAVGLAWFGQTMVRHPWLSLAAVLLAALAAAAVAYDRWKARRDLRRTQEAAAVLTEVIQNAPEGRAIKDGIARLGAGAEAAVRAVIAPIKERLKAAGRLAEREPQSE